MNKRFDFDKENQTGFDYLIGTDEAGRGPGAGPVFAAAVYFTSSDERLSKLNDSKQLSEKVREELYDVIKENSICFYCNNFRVLDCRFSTWSILSLWVKDGAYWLVFVNLINYNIQCMQ